MKISARSEHTLRVVTAAALSVALAVLSVLGLFSYVKSYGDARRAIRSKDQSAATALAQIQQMQSSITALEADVDSNRAEISELNTKVVALIEQVRQLGGEPVVAAEPQSPSVTTPTTAPRAGPSAPPATTPTTTTPTTAPPATTPPTTQPGNPPVSTPVCRLVGICVP